MVLEPMASSSQTESKLSIQTFHQCAGLISIKLSTNNYLLWKSQVLPLIPSLGLEHHLSDAEISFQTTQEEGNNVINPEYKTWNNNDGFLMTWLRGMMMEYVLTMIVGRKTAREIWLSIEEQMLQTIKEQGSWLKDSLYSLKKGTLKLEESLKKFKGICDNLGTIG